MQKGQHRCTTEEMWVLQLGVWIAEVDCDSLGSSLKAPRTRVAFAAAAPQVTCARVLQRAATSNDELNAFRIGATPPSSYKSPPLVVRAGLLLRTVHWWRCSALRCEVREWKGAKPCKHAAPVCNTFKASRLTRCRRVSVN